MAGVRAGELLSTETVAGLLGVRRMTVVRLIDRGAIEATDPGVPRKVRAFEVERYLRERTAKRRVALATLAGDIDANTPTDGVGRTRWATA